MAKLYPKRRHNREKKQAPKASERKTQVTQLINNRKLETSKILTNVMCILVNWQTLLESVICKMISPFNE